MRGSEHGNRYSPTGREILTGRTRRMIDVAAPRPEDIFMADIAYGLANQMRFTGQNPLQPTIAQHSLAVEHIVSKYNYYEHCLPRLAQSRAALMHDAAEYLVGDASGAVKLLMRTSPGGGVSAFDALEARAMAAITDRFDCANTGWEEVIHEADCLACAYEMAWGEWCTDAAPPTWLRADIDLSNCYLTYDWRSDEDDGGEARFMARARELGMSDA